jgi:hypothetical protein
MTSDKVRAEEASNAGHGGGNFVDATALAHVMRVGGEPRTSLITSTPDGRIPRTLAGLATPAPAGPTAPRPTVVHRDDNPESLSGFERCLTATANLTGPVLLPFLRNNNYQIVQSKDSVALMTEVSHDVRVIRLNQPHRTDGVRPWFGDSVGHYDGDTLVVETTNFPHQTGGLFGSGDNLKITERFTRVGDRAILYRFTVEDPTRWATSWGGEYEFHPAASPIYSDECHEGDKGLENTLGGARYAEAH